jgi:hypothetical protein
MMLTPALLNDILARVEGGAFPHVAAQAAGVPLETFYRWMASGNRKKSKEPYRGFARRVEQAQAHARCMAEVDMRQNDPKAWLIHGPGKSNPALPGWSAPMKPSINQDNRTINLLLQPQMQSLFAAILQVLSPYPEARAAVAAALAGKETPKQIEGRL